ncbi:DUF2795 domain-containing protein [Natronomonas sp. F2-12]|jgi:hypothetical protein|uniref:DUF2795 domain-containing protein n=1 Tax=Natronomonas aquatica TaxID=2841590 RepID=A0A9R1CSY1_9EURY|nr:DUF2795 domain-containing protein [Natronomonas aquatica]MCQ4333422.1 DUF2795 domain-containing protein [Natronomonas aquatica]
MRAFATANDRIDSHTFPATAAELIAEHGDVELDLPNGEETFGDALGRLGETTFTDAEDARLAAYSAVSKGAIGRQNYSDRDAPSIGENGPDPVSF